MNVIHIKKPLFQYLPLLRGKLRVSRYIYQKRYSVPISFKVKHGLQFTVPSLDDSIGYELYINGIYERKTIAYIVRNIPENGIFFDIGANIGALALFVAHLRPDVRVYAFEASTFIYSFLEHNIRSNKLLNIKAFNNAIYETDNQEMKFYAPVDQFGKGSFSQTYTNKEETVTTKRIDSFCNEHNIIPDLVKVDVQGYEYYVFAGMRTIIQGENKKPAILFEFEAWAEAIALGNNNVGAALKYLLDNNYKIENFKGLEVNGTDTMKENSEWVAIYKQLKQ